MKRALAVLVGLAIALIGSVAVAAWLSSGDGSGTAGATSVDRANAPTATPVSGTVSLSWTASTLANGAPVGGYRVLRHHGTDAPVEVCITTSPSCVDTQPLPGSVQYGVVATIGTQWMGPESDLTSFTFDDVAPVTTADVSPAPNAAGWSKTAVTVTLNATDSSGVDHIGYTVDGGSLITVSGATASFPVSGAGNHPVTYYAVDGVGNVETTQTLDVNIDPSAPVTTATPSPTPNAAGWNNTDVPLGFSATDVDASGVKSVTVDGVTTNSSTASKTVTAEGTTTVSYFATDVADNVEGTKSLTVKIDRTAPTTSIDPASSSSWTTDDTVAISASDALSGVASIEYRVDGGAIQSYTGSPFVLADGSHTVEFRATDAAGNVQAFQSATIKVDTTAPTSSIAETTSSTWTITASDASPSSGVSIEYWVDSGSHTTVSDATATVTVATGSHTIHWFAKDAAGNQQAQQDLAVVVPDTEAPTVTMSYPTATSPINNGQWSNSGCTPLGKAVGLCGTASDNVAVVGSALYELRRTSVSPNTCWNGASFTATACGSYQTAGGTGASWQIPMSYATLPSGTFQLRVKVSDAAGNSNRPASTPSGSPDVTFIK